MRSRSSPTSGASSMRDMPNVQAFAASVGNLVAGEPTLKIATHLIPRHCLAGGDNLRVPPLSRILELPPALFLFSLFGYRFQNETVRGGSSPFCCASDALLEILRQANGGRGHSVTPSKK